MTLGSPGDGSASVSRKSMNAKELRENAPLFRIAFDESVRTLEDQVKELNDMRQRLVQFLAFVGTATAFLVGSSLGKTGNNPIVRDWSFYALASLGTLTMVATLVSFALLVWPRLSVLQTTASGKAIIDKKILRNLSPTKSDGHLLHELTEDNEDAIVENDKVLDRAHGFYFWGIVLGLVQLGLWVSLVWTHA